jgi:hypothetical protein
MRGAERASAPVRRGGPPMIMEQRGGSAWKSQRTPAFQGLVYYSRVTEVINNQVVTLPQSSIHIIMAQTIPFSRRRKPLWNSKTTKLPPTTMTRLYQGMQIVWLAPHYPQPIVSGAGSALNHSKDDWHYIQPKYPITNVSNHEVLELSKTAAAKTYSILSNKKTAVQLAFYDATNRIPWR